MVVNKSEVTRLRPPLRIGQHLYVKLGRGAGFRDFLRLRSAKENRSNRRTLPATFQDFLSSESAPTLTPRIEEG